MGAYDEGYEAYSNGDGHNPYDYECDRDDFIDWEYGYSDAYQEKKETLILSS